MDSSADIAINLVIEKEGGLTDNPHDEGGITNMGISLRFLRSLEQDKLSKYGIFDTELTHAIKNLTREQAYAIYKGEFWNHANFEKIINQEHANFIFDMAVNMGINPAIKCAQRAVWAVLKNRDLIDDGILGNKTIAMLKLCGFLLMPALRAERANYYRLIVQRDPAQKEFFSGWLNRCYNSK